MVIKNMQQVSLEVEMRNKGNWNYNNPELEKVCTKPIANILIDGDQFVFKHEDIFKILEAYYKVDIESIKMIEEGNSGSIKSYETPFMWKLHNFIEKMQKDEILEQTKQKIRKFSTTTTTTNLINNK